MAADTMRALLEIYPDLRFDPRPELSDVVLGFDEESGEAVIEQWNHPSYPEPTQADLDSVALPLAKRDKRVELILAFDVEYADVWKVDGEIIEAIKDRIIFKRLANVALSAAEQNRMTQARSLMDTLDTKLIQVRDATTIEAVEAIGWP